MTEENDKTARVLSVSPEMIILLFHSTNFLTKFIYAKKSPKNKNITSIVEALNQTNSKKEKIEILDQCLYYLTRSMILSDRIMSFLSITMILIYFNHSLADSEVVKKIINLLIF